MEATPHLWAVLAQGPRVYSQDITSETMDYFLPGYFRGYVLDTVNSGSLDPWGSLVLWGSHVVVCKIVSYYVLKGVCDLIFVSLFADVLLCFDMDQEFV